MKRREQARQIALQALYQLDIRREDLSAEMVEFLRESTKDPEIYFFSRRLTEGAWGWRAEADRLIGQAAEHWRLERMAVLDRNIIRLAAYEISQCPDIPHRVAIDQAIELAKRFSSAESGSFVNGVLDRVLRTAKGEEAARASETAPAPEPAPETAPAPETSPVPAPADGPHDTTADDAPAAPAPAPADDD
ncbi:MAG: transcription antitermination factor NusB [Acidobacteria bacterium]|nr:transcription antitermination factor NusB [Acidobacteriota bacterium]